MSVDTLIVSKDGSHVGLLDTHVKSFLRHLRAAGCAGRTLRKKRMIAASFVRRTKHERVAVKKPNESHVAAFEKRSPRRRKARVNFELAVLRPFLGFLRLDAGVPSPAPRIDSSPGELDAVTVQDFLLDRVRNRLKEKISERYHLSHAHIQMARELGELNC